MPDTPKELIQALAHNAFLFFDNVSHITEVVSDILCKAVTGSGFPKRELYSDDDDIIYSFRRSIGINGINLVTTRPDLLERSLLIQLDRISDRDRKQENELDENFTRDLPLILGGIFGVLVNAIRVKSSLKLASYPRMADFTIWGCAIATVLGFTAENFLEAYKENIARQTEVVLNENIVASVLISFMEERAAKGERLWTGTPTMLLQDLASHAAFCGIETRFEKYWPRASNSLTRKLNELAVNLKTAGIVLIVARGNTREVTLEMLPKGDIDGNDDISHD